MLRGKASFARGLRWIWNHYPVLRYAYKRYAILRNAIDPASLARRLWA